MTLTALTSISSSPGVTSTALTWAQVSKKATLLVEADPTGGSPMLCIAWQGTQPHDRSVLDLAHYPVGEYPDRIWDLALPLPQRPKAAWVLPTVGSPSQARSLHDLWSPLCDVLQQLGRDSDLDVVVDLGRWNSIGYADPVLSRADSVLVVTDTTLSALNALAVGLPSIADRLGTSGSTRKLGVVPLLGNERGSGHRPYGPREIAQVLDSVPVLPGIARDARAAGERRWSGEKQRVRAVERVVRPRTAYPLSVQHLIDANDRHAAKAADYLATTQEMS